MRGRKTKSVGWKILQLNRLEEVAPLLAIAVLVVLPWLLPTEIAISEDMLFRTSQIAQAIDEAPWIINGRWTSRAVPVPAAATQILRPTAIFSRRYRAVERWDEEDDMSGVEATLVIVHCSEMRDMQGHYPPVCYPAYGWTTDNQGSKEFAFTTKTLGECKLTRYEFNRGSTLEGKHGIRILNFFLMPDGEVTPDIESLNTMKNRRSTSMLGVAQVQLVVDEDIDDTKCLKILEELVDGIPDLFRSLSAS